MADCDAIRNECGADRGAFSTLRFDRCARGFTLTVPDSRDYGRLPPLTFAFDKVEDLAKWLVDQYGPLPKEPVAKRPTARRRRR